MNMSWMLFHLSQKMRVAFGTCNSFAQLPLILASSIINAIQNFIVKAVAMWRGVFKNAWYVKSGRLKGTFTWRISTFWVAPTFGMTTATLLHIILFHLK